MRAGPSDQFMPRGLVPFGQTLERAVPQWLSDVMSRYSTSAVNDGTTHVAFGFLTGLVSLDFGLMIVLSCFRI
jgi:hypothetical protein